MTENEPNSASPCDDRRARCYDYMQLLSVLKADEAARKYLQYVIACECGNQATINQVEISASAVRKLELCGVFKLVDHRHMLADGIAISELELLLLQALDARVLAIPDRRLASQPSERGGSLPCEIRDGWLATWSAVQKSNQALNYFAGMINPKVTGLEHAKCALLLSLASAGDVYGDRGRKSKPVERLSRTHPLDCFVNPRAITRTTWHGQI